MPQVPLGAGAYKRTDALVPEVVLRNLFKSLFYCFSAMQSASNGVSVFAKRGNEIGNTSRNPFICHDPSTRCIAHLRSPRTPYTVLRAIGTVVIQPFNGGSDWLRSHVLKKLTVANGRSPSVPLRTYFYAPTSVSFPRWIFGIVAPVSHSGPNMIQRAVSVFFVSHVMCASAVIFIWQVS